MKCSHFDRLSLHLSLLCVAVDYGSMIDIGVSVRILDLHSNRGKSWIYQGHGRFNGKPYNSRITVKPEPKVHFHAMKYDNMG